MKDPMTREEAIELEQHALWKKFAAEVDSMVTATNEQLLVCSVEDCVKLQEKIKALKMCIRLPGIIAEREE